MADEIYTERKIVVGVALGGFLAGGYYFWRNFNEFDRPTAAMGSLCVAFLGLGVIAASVVVPWLDRIPNAAFWGMQIGLAYGAYRGFLTERVEEHLAAGRPEVSWKRTLTIALFSAVVTTGFLLGLLYFTGAFAGPEVRTFGRLQHEIAFYPNQLNAAEVDRLGRALTVAGFFDDEQQKTVDAIKEGDRYIINIYCNDTASDPDFIQLVKDLGRDVQRSFPANPIIIDLVIGVPENRIARIE